MKSPQDGADKYVKNTANAQGDWQTGANTADWQTPAASAEAEANYATEQQKAIINKSRQKAIEATPNSVYKAGIDANPDRYSTGTAAARAKVVAVASKLYVDIGTLRDSLPKRGSRGSTVNIMQRGTQIQSALTKNRGKYKARGIAKNSGVT